jgi:hypothetical protein
MRRVARILVDLLIALHFLGFIAVLWTGGYRLELFGLELKSHSLLPVVRGLIVLILIRVFLVSRFKNFLLVFVSTVMSLLFCEFLIRIWDPPMAQTSLEQIHHISDIYDWELLPGAKGVGLQGEIIQINAMGFRDSEWQTVKPPDGQRIAVLGDSFTFGMAVNLDDTYVKQAEHILKAWHPRVETLNFGVIGYGMWQYLELLDRKIFDYDPDLVVLGLFLDDILQSVPPYTKKQGWKPHNPFEHIVTDKHKSSVSRLWNFVRNFNELLEAKYRYKRGHMYLQGIAERKREIGPANPEHDFYKAQIGGLDKQIYLEFRGAMQRLADMTKAHKIPVIILYIPDASQLHEDPRQHINRFVKDAAREADVPFIDLTPVFEQVEDPRLLYLFPLDAHTSQEGHRLIAKVLVREIEKRKFLSGP